MAIVVLILAIIAVTAKFLFTDDQEINRLLTQLKQTRSTVDSLQTVNSKLMTQVDSLQNQYKIQALQITQMGQRIATQKKVYDQILGSLNDFKGSSDSLLNELNRVAHTNLVNSPN
jgi:chromosome segregation ATPase